MLLRYQDIQLWPVITPTRPRPPPQIHGNYRQHSSTQFFLDNLYPTTLTWGGLGWEVVWGGGGCNFKLGRGRERHICKIGEKCFSVLPGMPVWGTEAGKTTPWKQTGSSRLVFQSLGQRQDGPRANKAASV